MKAVTIFFMLLLVTGVILFGVVSDFTTTTKDSRGNVSTIEALHVLRGTTGQTVDLAGYRRPADGGQGTFLWTADERIEDGCITFLAPGGTWRRRIGNEHWDWRWCGAYGDEKHDDTEAIQAFYSAASAAIAKGSPVGVTAEPSPGRYLISHAIVVRTSHIHTISHWGDVTLNSRSPEEDIFAVGDKKQPLYDVTFDGLTLIKSGIGRTLGYAINFDYGAGFAVERTDINGAGKLYGGIRLHRTFQSRIENTTIENTLGESVVLSGEDSRAGATSDIFVENVRSIACRLGSVSKSVAEAGGCFRIDDFTSGLFFSNIEIFGNPRGYGFYFNTKLSHSAANGQNGTAVFNNINADGSGELCQGGIYIQNYSLVTVGGGSWISGNNCDTISIAETADHVFISPGTTIGVNHSGSSHPRGVVIGGSYISLSGVTIKNYKPGAGEGVFISGATQELFIGGGTSIEDFSTGMRVLDLENKHYIIDGLRFVGTRDWNGDLVGFGGDPHSDNNRGLSSFAGSITNVRSSDATSRTFVATPELDLPAGLDLYFILGTTPIRQVHIRYVGEVVRLLFRDKGAKIGGSRSGLGSIETSNSEGLITTRNNQIVTIVTDGTTWYQAE